MTQLQMIYDRAHRRLARLLQTILKEWDFRTPVVKEYFALTCNDIISGATLPELYSSIDLFASLEYYEECEGILLACEISTTLALTNYIFKLKNE